MSAGTTPPVPYTWLAPQRPNHEPSASCAFSSHTTARLTTVVSARPSLASASTTWAVTSADGGSMTAPKSQNGSLHSSRVLSASKAPKPPSREAMPFSHWIARSIGSEASGNATLRSARGSPRRCRRCRGRRRCRTRTPSRPAGCPVDAPTSPRAPDLLVHDPSAPRAGAGSSGGVPESPSAFMARTVSQTGDWHASSAKRPCSSRIVNRSRPSSPRRMTGWPRS